MFSNIPDICDPTQKDGFICPGTQVFGTASIIWGVIGPMRVFSPGQIYSGVWFVLISSGSAERADTGVGLLYFFLIGALCPAIAYLISLKWPNSFIRYVKCVPFTPRMLLVLIIGCVSFPVLFSGMGAIPPASAVNYVPWAIVGFIFNYWIRRKHFSWWVKYNCTCFTSGPQDDFAVELTLRFS